MRTKTGHPKTTKFAVYVDNSGYEASLELHKIYPVIPDAGATRDRDLRIIDESGEDYLYESDRFIAIEVPSGLKRGILKRAS